MGYTHWPWESLHLPFSVGFLGKSSVLCSHAAPRPFSPRPLYSDVCPHHTAETTWANPLTAPVPSLTMLLNLHPPDLSGTVACGPCPS